MRRVWTGIDWLSRRLALWTNDAVPWLLIALLLSRHMRGGLAGAGTATMPRRHGITRPPSPPSGEELFLLPPYFIYFNLLELFIPSKQAP